MIVCIGDLMLDVLVLPGATQDALPSGIYLRPGGSAANTAAWAVWAGAKAALVAVIGTDEAGHLLLHSLTHDHVQSAVTSVEAESGVVISRIGRSGNRTMHSARWAAAHLRPEHIPADLIRAAVAVHITGYALTSEGGLQAAQRALTLGREASALRSVDPSCVPVIERVGREPFLRFLRAYAVDVIFPNREEAKVLTGLHHPAEAARALGEWVSFAVVKAGRRGCYLGNAGVVEHVPTARIKPIDTTGAGDAFAGTWLATYTQCVDAHAACIAANAAAARAIAVIGARPTGA
jgi:sugar/nucleoside kinase (ribokinase family)